MPACILPTLRRFVLFGSAGLFQEKAITPGESLSLAGTDWLIGNHSDELTPWIPVMAARRVISTLNLTQPLECQLMSLKGDCHYRPCECVCEARRYVTSLVGLLGAMLSLRLRLLVYWTMSTKKLQILRWHVTVCIFPDVLLLWLQVLVLLPLLCPAVLFLWLLWEIPEASVQEVSVQRVHWLHHRGQQNKWL